MSLDALRAAVSSTAQPTTTVDATQLSGLRSALRGTGEAPPIEQRIEESLSIADRLAQVAIAERARAESARSEREVGVSTGRGPWESIADVTADAPSSAPSSPSMAEALRRDTSGKPVQGNPTVQQQQTQTPTPAREVPTISIRGWLPGASTSRDLHNLKIDSIMLEQTPGGVEARRIKDSMLR